MKIRKHFIAVFLAAFLLAGCGPGIFPSESGETPIPGETITPDASTPFGESEDPNDPGLDLPPRDGMVRSRLTNEWVDEVVAGKRPIAVIIPNEEHAQPHFNLSSASVVYEAKVEGNMTRLMAIYEDWENLQMIGNVRSLRSYFAYWAFEWDSVIVHYGGPYFIYDLLNEETTDNVDGMYDNTAFFRTPDREPPHNAFASGATILNSIQKDNYSLEYRGLTEESHFLFAGPGEPNDLSQYGDNAKEATYVDMTASYPLTRCYFKYNEEDGLYYRSQYLSGGTDGPHVDGYTYQQLSFSNLLVQRIVQEDIGNGYLAMQCHDTTKDGWFFTQGKGIHVTWEKIGDYGATKFYDDNGDEICLNTGKTMILVIRDTDHFTYR